MTDPKQNVEPFPGGIGVTHLRVYDTPAADGLVGGSPHLHFACAEAYLVIKGRGSVQTLSSEGFREIPLLTGSLVWFTPGLIHRLINLDGQLVRSKESTWRHVWEAGPARTIRRTKSFLDKLNAGASDYLNQGRVFAIPVDLVHEERKLGMCGTLRPYLPEGVLIAG